MVHNSLSPADISPARDTRLREASLQEDSNIPVAAMVENIVGCKWSVRLLRLLDDGHNRPSALLRACPGLSTKVMNERLRKMMRFGIIRRTVFGEKPPIEVEYRLTPFGGQFVRILDEIQRLQAAVDSGKLDWCDEG